MRWFRFGSGGRQAQTDPGRQQELLRELRTRFGGQATARFAGQAAEAAALLDGDDGLVAATLVLRESADTAFAAMAAQGFPVERRDYRWTWQSAGTRLRSPLTTVPAGAFHPYVQTTAAVTVAGNQAKQLVRIVDANPVLTHVLELLDLVTAGWEYGGVRPDADSATLAARLIAAARDIRDAMSDTPPLPSPIREQMRRNNTVDVRDPATNRVVGGFNPGKEMREALLA
ncbi:hypothetical protein KZ829_26685 [Actinoplanes hulinensis]|uniref:Uncharacterized protein n=1 Tax=Actinoplanes hulinensis TaxID=1144547 RepID=A0ABS7B8N4_9ACTN|nr:hypothetical protein [Actinoplanes hulinensis]MBW6437328.1 hypothetical protein [Actinoplanes hulinensis]